MLSQLSAVALYGTYPVSSIDGLDLKAALPVDPDRLFDLFRCHLVIPEVP